MATTTFTTSVITDSRLPIFNYAASGDGLIVNAGVTLANQGNYAVSTRGHGRLQDLTAVINGTVSAPSWSALDAYGSSIDVTVGSTGRLESTGAMAFEASYGSTLANHGTLYARDGFGAVFTDVTEETAVENWGTIFGQAGALSFGEGAIGGVVSVVNHGTLEAGSGNHGVGGEGRDQGIFSHSETTNIVNEGAILAAHLTGAAIKVVGATATLENSGTIESAHYWGVIAEVATDIDVINSGTISGPAGSLWLTRTKNTVVNDGHLDGRVVLWNGNDIYHGENGRVTGAVWGQQGNDLLVGGRFTDILGGGNGNDTLTGGAGNDVLTGAGWGDVISGGSGEDVFRYALASDATADRIVASGGVAAFEGAGVAGGDRVDVSAIDADTAAAGEQHFSFGTTRGVGDLWAVDVGDVTHIRGNTTGGGGPEFDLAIHDGAGVTASDYAAIDFIL